MIGPTGIIRNLWKEGYFKERRSLWDIENKMEGLNYHFKKTAVLMTVKRANFLIEAGKYSNGVQSFIQKYPPGIENIERHIPEYIKLFNLLSLHPEIRRVSEKLFTDGHYTQAIFEAFKQLNVLVKKKSEKYDDDGKSLMLKVFSVKTPILKLNELKDQSDKDEQEGFMHLFAGAIQGIRNPKGHENIIQKDPYKTIEYLCLASLLAKMIDSSEK